MSSAPFTANALRQHRDLYEAYVDAAGNADYLLPSAAFADGNTRVYVRNGTYNETVNITLPSGGILVGESKTGVIISLTGAIAVQADGNGGTTLTAGTITATAASDAILGAGTAFTTLTGVGTTAFILVNGIFRQVASVADNTNLTLSEDYEGTTTAGLAYVAQTMHTGIGIHNLTVTGGTSNGIFLRAVRLGELSSVLVIEASGASPLANIQINDSGNCTLTNVESSDCTGRGLNFDRSFSCAVQSLNCHNNDNHGVFLDNGTIGVLFDSCILTANALSGIRVENSLSSNIEIVDSIVSHNRSVGIDVSSTAGIVLVDTCTVENNTSFGIDFDGLDNTVTNSNIRDNTGSGVTAGDNGVITGNLISGNGSNGISLNGDTSCAVTGNRIVNNTTDGIQSAGTNNNNTISGNYIEGNTIGISIAGTATNYSITGNVINTPTGDGINLSGTSLSTISGNVVTAGVKGIDLGSTSTDCIVSNNKVSGTSDNGIDISSSSDRAVISGNLVTGAGAIGIETDGDLCSITGNTVRSSTTIGICVNGADCTVSCNVISANTGDGIEVLAAGLGCVITGNRIIGNAKGIDINAASTSAVITGNFVSGGGGEGIEVAADDCTITGNVSSGNTGDGIMILSTADNCTVASNRCSGNSDDGLEIVAGATNTIVTGNNFTGNSGTNLVDAGTATLSSNNFAP